MLYMTGSTSSTASSDSTGPKYSTECKDYTGFQLSKFYIVSKVSNVL